LRAMRPVVSAAQGAEHAAVAGLPLHLSQIALTELAGFARDGTGRIWSWGLNAQGQLGRSLCKQADEPRSKAASTSDFCTQLSWQAPAVIPGLAAMRSLATGHSHVLALDHHGKVWAWGANSAGQLGNNSLQASARPVHVKLPSRITHIAAGDTHSFAVDEHKRLWAWGSNNFGQLGHSAGKYLAAPQRVVLPFAVRQVDAGMFYSVATTQEGDVFAWGWNGLGQLGQPALAASAQPMRMSSLSHVTHLAAGAAHVLAASEQGVFAWGDNRSSACGAVASVRVQLAPNRMFI
jgi:alpha-tubulin suppressor-like RCC1 family protein